MEEIGAKINITLENGERYEFDKLVTVRPVKRKEGLCLDVSSNESKPYLKLYIVIKNEDAPDFIKAAQKEMER